MTRSEFLENVTTFGELIDVCNDAEVWHIYEDEDVLTADEYDTRVKEDISSSWDSMQWSKIGDLLSELPDYDGGTYYIGISCLEYRVADEDDFDRLKQIVLEHFDADDLWDEEELEEEVSSEEIEAMLLSVEAYVKAS